MNMQHSDFQFEVHACWWHSLVTLNEVILSRLFLGIKDLWQSQSAVVKKRENI